MEETGPRLATVPPTTMASPAERLSFPSARMTGAALLAVAWVATVARGAGIDTASMFMSRRPPVPPALVAPL
jgi:hypothetical protein